MIDWAFSFRFVQVFRKYKQLTFVRLNEYIRTSLSMDVTETKRHRPVRCYQKWIFDDEISYTG